MYKLFCILLSIMFFQTANAEQINYEDYLLGAGDTIRIIVYGNSDLTTETRVSASGTISFPWIGEINVLNNRTTQVEQVVATQLSKKGYLIDPQINVTVIGYQSKTFSILGNVAKPGKYSLDKPMTLTEAIAMASGTTITASDVITVMSTQNGELTKHDYDLRDFFINGNNTSNPRVLSGDVIYVPKYPVFYIFGEVQRPNAYKLEQNMTVSQALATGGGLTLRATQKHIKIDRKKEDGTYTKIEAKANDILQANDVLYVEESLF